jgi:signal transduction histidine kinase
VDEPARNAIDALGESGTITITTRVRRQLRSRSTSPTTARRARGRARRIFDPFFTTKDVGAGTGLGLDTARRIVVDRHGGSLQLLSPAQGGALFRVRLPLTAA